MLTLYYLLEKSKKNIPDIDQYYSKLQENRCLNVKDLSSKCRVCLQEGSVSIYGDENAEIVEALQTIAGIQLNEDDEYTKHLCGTCYKFLKGAIAFREIAKRSEEILMRPVKTESIFEQPDHDFSDSSAHDTKQSEIWSIEVCNVKNEIKEVEVPKIPCDVCNKLITRSYYKEHITMHDPDHKKFVCDVCGKSFRLRCAYYNHSLRHRTDFPYKCQFCPYQGKYPDLLKYHMRTHTRDYRYMCTECPARFLFKSNFNRHILKHKDPQFECDACKSLFRTKLMLKRHFEAVHLGVKNHVCDICQKLFSSRNAMMKHQRQVHKREKCLYGRMPAYLQAESRNQNDDNL